MYFSSIVANVTALSFSVHSPFLTGSISSVFIYMGSFFHGGISLSFWSFMFSSSLSPHHLMVVGVLFEKGFLNIPWVHILLFTVWSSIMFFISGYESP